VFSFVRRVLAWQLGGLPAETFARMRRNRWALAIGFAAVTSFELEIRLRHPIVFSTMITMCLIAAAWLSAKKPI